MGLEFSSANTVHTAIQATGFAGGVDANIVLLPLLEASILNPFREITFKGANYRNHNFNVKMDVKETKTEEKEIKQIVNTLRYHASSLSNGTSNAGQGETTDVRHSFITSILLSLGWQEQRAIKGK